MHCAAITVLRIMTDGRRFHAAAKYESPGGSRSGATKDILP